LFICATRSTSRLRYRVSRKVKRFRPSTCRCSPGRSPACSPWAAPAAGLAPAPGSRAHWPSPAPAPGSAPDFPRHPRHGSDASHQAAATGNVTPPRPVRLSPASSSRDVRSPGYRLCRHSPPPAWPRYARCWSARGSRRSTGHRHSSAGYAHARDRAVCPISLFPRGPGRAEGDASGVDPPALQAGVALHLLLGETDLPLGIKAVPIQASGKMPSRTKAPLAMWPGEPTSWMSMWPLRRPNSEIGHVVPQRRPALKTRRGAAGLSVRVGGYAGNLCCSKRGR
jgi:hypothetical protein